MLRYHKKVYFPLSDNEKLVNFTKKLNSLNWQYSKHCLENLKYRVINMQSLLAHIKELILNKNDIFEYYKENDTIIKACFRIKWNEFDFILVLSDKKCIVTIYINSKNDNHDTLKKEIYSLI